MGLWVWPNVYLTTKYGHTFKNALLTDKQKAASPKIDVAEADTWGDRREGLYVWTSWKAGEQGGQIWRQHALLQWARKRRMPDNVIVASPHSNGWNKPAQRQGGVDKPSTEIAPRAALVFRERKNDDQNPYFTTAIQRIIRAVPSVSRFIHKTQLNMTKCQEYFSIRHYNIHCCFSVP